MTMAIINSKLTAGKITGKKKKNTTLDSVSKKTYTYNPTKAAAEAYTAYRRQEASAPDYTKQIDSLARQIANREPFSYNPASDAAYKYYADRYRQQGKLAMQDTIGQATQLSGGYDNSYANTVGQQQYNAYLRELNDVLPSLKSAALDAYNTDGNNLVAALSAYQAAQAANADKTNKLFQRWAKLQSATDKANKRKSNGGGRRKSEGSSNASVIKSASLDTLAASFGSELMKYRSDYATANGGNVNAPYLLEGQVITSNLVDDKTELKMIDYLVSEGFTKTRAKELLKYMGFAK